MFENSKIKDINDNLLICYPMINSNGIDLPNIKCFDIDKRDNTLSSYYLNIENPYIINEETEEELYQEWKDIKDKLSNFGNNVDNLEVIEEKYKEVLETITGFILALNEEENINYDGIIILDRDKIINIITLQSSDQIKPITNEKSTSSNKINENYLFEATRSQLINKSKSGQDYKDKSKGRNRWERRTRSTVSTSVREYNNIDMDAFFKRDILNINVLVHGETDDYVVGLRFPNVLRELQQNIKANNNLLDFKTVLRTLSKVFNSGDVFIKCNCLHPTTKIRLLDGTTCTIEEMYKRFENGEKLWVFSTDKNGDFKPGEVEKVWKTKTTKEFIKVTLDNGEEILTTPEHPYMLRDGTYSFAENLKEGQSLMPLYFNSTNGYLTVKLNTEFRGWRSVYKLVAEETKQKEIKEKEKQAEIDSTDMRYKVAIHHKDFNKNNNTPENLQIMTSKEHWNYHANLCGKNRPISDRQRISASKHIKQLNANPTENLKESRRKWQEKGKLRNYDEDRKLQQAEIMKKISRDFWDNPENVDKRKKVLQASHNEETRKKVSESHKQLWTNMSEEEYQRRCQINKESNLKSIEKRKESAKRMWQNKSEEERKLWIKKSAESRRGKKRGAFTEEHKQKIVQSIRNRTQEEKTKYSNNALLTKCKKIIIRLIDNNLPLTEESYQKNRKGTNEPYIQTIYKKLNCNTFEQVLDLCGFKDIYNHKIIKVERVILEETPVYDIKVKKWENFLVDAGIVLHNCPDAKYRFNYQQWKNGYGLQYEPRPADKTNPHDALGAGCKHTLMVISNLNWMMKIATVIVNYIKYCQQNLQKSYADYIFPKLYGMPYKNAIQLDLFDSGLLPSDRKTLSNIINPLTKGRDEKGRFIQDNPYIFKKKDLIKTPKGQLELDTDENKTFKGNNLSKID